MDYKEIINFLEVLLCRLQNEGAGARKIDMVAEAMGMISAAEDEQTVRTQLWRVNELMESLYGTSKGGAGDTQVRPGRRSAPEIQFMENIKEITAAAHRECLTVGETFVSSAGELAGSVERDIHDLSGVKASYDDLTDARRLENRLNMIKKRYQNRLKGSKQTFIGELTAVYDAAMEKVKAKFTRPEAGSLQMTRKQLYERFDAGHDSFLMRSRNVGDSLDLAGAAFEKLGKRLGEKVAAAKRRATAMTALVLVISFAVWGLLLGTAGKKAYDAVTECIKLAETIQNPQELPDGTDVNGDIVKKVLDSDLAKEAYGAAVEKPTQAIIEGLRTAINYAMIILLVILICFYVCFVPFLAWFRKELCIRRLERVVPEETAVFLKEVQLGQRLSRGVQEIIEELEGMYSTLYQDLGKIPVTAPTADVGAAAEDTAAEELIRSWQQLTAGYNI